MKEIFGRTLIFGGKDKEPEERGISEDIDKLSMASLTDRTSGCRQTRLYRWKWIFLQGGSEYCALRQDYKSWFMFNDWTVYSGVWDEYKLSRISLNIAASIASFGWAWPRTRSCSRCWVFLKLPAYWLPSSVSSFGDSATQLQVVFHDFVIYWCSKARANCIRNQYLALVHWIFSLWLSGHESFATSSSIFLFNVVTFFLKTYVGINLFLRFVC